jgi:hypothetical protein
LLIQPTTSVSDIVSHIEKAQCKALVLCEELLPVCKQIFDRLPILPARTYCLTESPSLREALKVEIKSLAQLLTKGHGSERLQNRWVYAGNTFTEVAYLCATSGTSGRQVCLLHILRCFPEGPEAAKMSSVSLTLCMSPETCENYARQHHLQHPSSSCVRERGRSRYPSDRSSPGDVASESRLRTCARPSRDL